MTLQPSRAALYDKLPTELADLCRSARVYTNLMAEGLVECASSELELLKLLAEKVRRWEDRQLRLQVEAKKAEAPKRRLRRRAKSHLRLVKG